MHLCIEIVTLKMAHTFVLHDESVNTYGFRMLTSGANLDEFRKNPVMLYNHNDWNMPIGRWENIRVEGTQILADAVFDESDPEGRRVKDKVEGGFLRMASIGAWPPEEVSDDPILKLPGQTGTTVLRWTVREASICSIGANHNALAFYDKETERRIDLSDETGLIRLMDGVITRHNNNQTQETMALNKILGLSDNATPQEQEAAVAELKKDHERLKGENETLQAAIDEQNAERRAAEEAEAVALIDAAVRDGRINADGKETYIKLFSADHAAAKAALAAIPQRKSVAQTINNPKQVALSDLEAKSWQELDKADLLVELKDKHPELYKQKFKERFGTEYRGN